jgi:hypothetical protein
LYTENRVLKELGVAAVETIEKMDEEIELKNNKIKGPCQDLPIGVLRGGFRRPENVTIF